jgi:16S rRNA (cytidine1402-2'-O)-methyltransferase
MAIDPSAEAPNEAWSSQSTPPKGLLLVSTPIGNLADMTERARATLSDCDVVLCEDTRRTGHLLSILGIHVKMEALHEHNEDARIPAILERLRLNQTVALVTDAGTPVVSDPGYRLVRAAINEGLPVSAIPGANAAVMALVLSGLPPAPFLFMGFPLPRQTARRTQLANLRSAERAGLSATLIWYEAPHRLVDMLSDLRDVFGNRSAAVARELTKRFETVHRGLLDELLEHFRHEAPRGEITVVLGPAPEEGHDDLDEQLRTAMASHSVKDAAAVVSVATGLPRKTVYTRALQIAAETSGL